MRIEPLGDSAFLLRDLPGPAYEIALAANALEVPGLREAVAAYDTVGLYVDPFVFQAASFLEALDRSAPRGKVPEPKRHVVPVCYELGEDFEAVCALLGLTRDRFVQEHAGRPYRCYAIGFCPGFPYLGTLADALAGGPRRERPRLRVPAGSVAITGDQAGVYPAEGPGGWALVGRTPLQIVDVEADFFPIAAGDEVVFEPIDVGRFEALRGRRL
jgi:inhibitor of KinA